MLLKTELKHLKVAMNRRIAAYTTFILLVFTAVNTSAQDVTISQFLANPLLTNPALTGSRKGLQTTVTYRNQWPNLFTSFESAAATLDQNLAKLNSGIGASFVSTKIGGDALISLVLSTYYAYHLEATSDLMFNFGIKGTYFYKSINWTRIISSVQYSSVREMVGVELGNPSTSIQNFDFSLGTSFSYKNVLYGGLSVDHITTPNISFFKYDTLTNLGIKTSIFVAGNVSSGKRIFRRIKNSTLSYTPMIFYQGNSDFKQLSLGSYLNVGFLVLGAWYRKDFNNDGSMIGLIGTKLNQFYLAYSFDYTLTYNPVYDGGAHEITLSFNIDNQRYNRNSTKLGRIPSPIF